MSDTATSEFALSAPAGARLWIDRVSDLDAAPADVVGVLRDVDAWPSWTPGLTSLQRNRSKPLVRGGHFLMWVRLGSMPPMPLPCTLFRDEPDGFQWGGGFAGGEIRHSLEWVARADGGCRVRHLEYATGWLGMLARPLEGAARAHDERWSDAIEARFAR